MTSTTIEGAAIEYRDGHLWFQPRADTDLLWLVLKWDGTRETWAESASEALARNGLTSTRWCRVSPVLGRQAIGWTSEQAEKARDWRATVQIAARFAAPRQAAE